jgi:hypothetical protein
VARASEQKGEDRKGFGSELYFLRSFPQALIDGIQTKGIENDLFFHSLLWVHPELPNFYGGINVYSARSIVHGLGWPGNITLPSEILLGANGNATAHLLQTAD